VICVVVCHTASLVGQAPIESHLVGVVNELHDLMSKLSDVRWAER
jgi:hypothetical protein